MAEIKNDVNFKNLLARPDVGSALTILSGLSFLFLCMILPLVGKAGVQRSHYTLNFTAFLLVLVLTLVLAVLAVKSKIDRSKTDGSPFPVFSSLIAGVSLLLLVALLNGLLHI